MAHTVLIVIHAVAAVAALGSGLLALRAHSAPRLFDALVAALAVPLLGHLLVGRLRVRAAG